MLSFLPSFFYHLVTHQDSDYNTLDPPVHPAIVDNSDPTVDCQDNSYPTIDMKLPTPSNSQRLVVYATVTILLQYIHHRQYLLNLPRVGVVLNYLLDLRWVY